jgi:hypothetical protein
MMGQVLVLNSSDRIACKSAQKSIFKRQKKKELFSPENGA